MKKILSLTIVILLIASLFTGCMDENNTNENIGESDHKEVITFSALDIKGNKVTDDIFDEYTLTLINVWGTFCSPCIEEMDELQQLYSEYVDKDVNVIGIVADGRMSKDEAFVIVSKKKVTFTNVIPDEDLEKGFLSGIEYVPTTYFVNSKGEVIGDPIVGAGDFKSYSEEIEKRLKEIN